MAPRSHHWLAALARFRNPHLAKADNLDCAGCHYADTASVLSEPSPVDAFANPATQLFNLHMGAIVAGSARIPRASGYHGTQLAVSRRTINDSALVAHRMNHREPDQDLRSVDSRALSRQTGQKNAVSGLLAAWECCEHAWLNLRRDAFLVEVTQGLFDHRRCICSGKVSQFRATQNSHADGVGDISLIHCSDSAKQKWANMSDAEYRRDILHVKLNP